MRTRSFRIIRLALATGLAAAISTGCASTPKEPAPDDYVFFGASPNLKRVSAKRGVFLYVNPGKPLSDYRKFIVESSGIYFQTGSAHWIDKTKSDELASFFCKEVMTSLSGAYQVTGSPGPGVLRVSLTLGDVRRRRTDASSGSSASGGKGGEEYQPVLRILLSDSTTGEEVLLLRDITRGSEFAETLKQRGDAGAKELLREWARLFREKIDEARQANGQTSQSTRS